jgi:tripartite-type tricarboxylate transporter receptor subunit TctC
VRKLVSTIGLMLLGGLAAPTAAETYPTRAITMVVPYAAGGPVDTLARILSEAMRKELKQPIIVENIGGASGTIALSRVVKAAADGYTLCLGHTGTHVVNGAIYPLTFDVYEDFEPIGLISATPELIVVRKDFPAKDLKEFIAWLKANPDKALMGTSGVGSSGQIAAALFQQQTGTKFQYVPYRGLAPAMQGLLAGEVDMMIDVPSNSIQHVKGGSIRALAIMDKQRLPSLSDVPTVDEVGMPGFHASLWYAMWALKGTPKDIVAKLNGALKTALSDPVTRERFAKANQPIVPVAEQTPEYLRKFQKAEIDKWWPIIKDAGIKVQ